MRSDVVRWNKKYADHSYSDEIVTDPILVSHKTHLSGKGNSLDLACGVCNNALYLASIGYNSFAVDGSKTALFHGKRKARANKLDLLGFVADLDSYSLPEEYFHVVVVIRYLNRTLIDSIKRTLKPGGILFMQTFNARFLVKKPAFPKDYVLRDGELSDWFSGWRCIDTNDDDVTSRQTETYWVGTKN